MRLCNFLIAAISILTLIADTRPVSAQSSNRVDLQNSAGSVLNSHASIQQCANAAVAGQTCLIQPGTYDERVVPPVNGSAGLPITFRGTSGAKVRGFNVFNRSYITIAELEITNAGMTSQYGPAIAVNAADHIVIRNNNIHDTTGDGDGVCIKFGSDPTGTTNLVNYSAIKDNTIIRCGAQAQGGGHSGIAMEIFGSDNLIDHNDISHLGDDFSRVIAGSRNILRNNFWHDNVPADWPGSVAHVDGMQNWSSTGDLPVQHLLIESNVMSNSWDNDSHFALFQNYAHLDQRDMVFRYNTGHRVGDGILGADSAPTPGIRVYNNTWAVMFNQRYANNDGLITFSANSTGAKLFNNIFYNSGILSGYSPYNYFDTSGSGFASDYNMAYDTGFSGSWRAPIGAEAHNSTIMNRDPLFVSYPTDFSLQSSSPLIDKGGPLTAAINSGSSSATLTVGDAGFFQDGWGGGAANGVQADWIALGSASNAAQVSSINYAANTITLVTPLSWSAGAPVFLYRDSNGRQVLAGTAPDVGSHEYGSGPIPPAVPSPPTGLRILTEG